MKKVIQNILFFLLGLYIIAGWWTFQQVWDKEPLTPAIVDSITWPYFWYNVIDYTF